MGYTNTDNPFGDCNLQQSFLWKKKYEKLGIKDIDPAEIERLNKIKLEKNKRELEKVKQRRIEREREREERLRELEKERREKEANQFKEWAKQEDSFHLKQAKLRSKLRLKDGRAKPIDILARYIDVFGDKESQENTLSCQYEDIEFDLVVPYLCFNGLRISDLEDLEEDIKVYQELDSNNNSNYWGDLQIIVADELSKLRNFHLSQKNSHERRGDGVNAAVSDEVASVFKGKTPAQLQVLQMSIEKKITSRQEGIDISYWETLLSKLKAQMARARLKEFHEANIKKRLAMLNQERIEPNKISSIPESVDKSETKVSEVENDDTQNFTEETDKTLEEYEQGRYSPVLLQPHQLDADIVLTDPEEDLKLLNYKRRQILSCKDEAKPSTSMSSQELAFEREARRGMGSDESGFSVEEVIKQDKSVAAWSDKYRPRKPRYFNRVHTGFEWNKYNQTHYDVDNPPPKIVQGYKFNIFYPDLIDKNQTPSYTVTTCEDNKDFAIIRFKAGPPYEDIAFKIVQREWNYSYKNGFRSQFHNNMFQLWFHFKRYRYRR